MHWNLENMEFMKIHIQFIEKKPIFLYVLTSKHQYHNKSTGNIFNYISCIHY